MKRALKFCGFIVLLLMVAIGCVLMYITFALPSVSAAPEINVDKEDEALVSRGAYLANHVAACMDCHSTRDWTKFAGPLVAGTEGGGGEVFDEKMGLPGTFYSRNITPHGLLDWTDGEIYRLITTGVTKDGEPIFPVMPFQSYSKMAPGDVNAIIAYLRTLPAIAHSVPESSAAFPVNLIMRTTPKDAIPMTLTHEMSILEKGEYLVTIAGCGECHTPKDKGVPIEGMALAGGFEFKLPTGGVVRSANLTSDKETGLGLWTAEAFVDRFKIYADSAYISPNVENNTFNTVMPWMMYAKMKAEDLEAIFAYLQTVAPINHKVVKFSPDAVEM